MMVAITGKLHFELSFKLSQSKKELK